MTREMEKWPSRRFVDCSKGRRKRVRGRKKGLQGGKNKHLRKGRVIEENISGKSTSRGKGVDSQKLIIGPS